MGTSRETMRSALRTVKEAALTTICRLPLLASWSLLAALALSGMALISGEAAEEPRVISEFALGLFLPFLVGALLGYLAVQLTRLGTRSDRTSR